MFAKVLPVLALLALAAATPQIKLQINHGAGKAYKLKNPVVREHDTIKGLKSRQDWTQKCAAGTKTNHVNCPFPVAQAHDHHDEQVPVTTRVFLIDQRHNGKAGATRGHFPVEVKKVDFTKRGTYLFKYDAKDRSGNNAEQVVFGLILDDGKAPTINLCNGNKEVVEAASNWKLCSQTVATDNLDGATPLKYTVRHNGKTIVSSVGFAKARAAISTRVVGKWTVQVDTSDYASVYGRDGQSNTASAKKTITIQDTRAPYIHLIGANPAVHECARKTYKDAKATAGDLLDGEITKKIKTVSTVIDKQVGKYTVTFDVRDKAGNKATTVTRDVKVVDTTKPAMSLKGDKEVVHYSGKKFTDAGVVTKDTCDKNLAPVTMKWDKPFNDRIVGTYLRTYTVVDASGNTNSARRTFTIVDNTKPVLTIRGKDLQTLEATRDSEYVDQGAKCHDYVDGALSHAVEVSGKVVNMRIPGTYKITYSCQDLSGNEAKKIHRVIVVRDSTCPKVKVNGASLNYVEAGFPYTDAGAKATDSLDGDLTKAITTDGDTVDTAQVFYNRRSCKEIKDYFPKAKTGEYFITPKNSHRTLVWCYMPKGETVYPCKNCKRTMPYGKNHGSCTKKGMFMAKYGAKMMKVAAKKFPGFSVTKGATTDNYFCSTNDAHIEYHEHKKSKNFPKRAEAGKFIINYHVMDRAGNNECKTAKRTVIVKETLPPVVSLKLMAETVSVNGWMFGAIASAVAGLALLGYSSKTTVTIDV
jgi:hypothetical protein